MKKIVMMICLLAAGIAVAAAFTVRGILLDSDGAPLPFAAVQLLNPADSTLAYADSLSTATATPPKPYSSITADDGAFAIEGVREGDYLLKASYVGFDPVVFDISIIEDTDLGAIPMNSDAVMLHNVTVQGIRTPIRVAQDTVEYNASSYSTQPNAVVEDLLKRLPGVEVGSDGKITHNGRQISKILIDGQEFFADDPAVASRNLPANMIDKLQVVDRRSDVARLTGVDDGNDETVINLTVKKGMNNGWFGTVEAGYGTDGRYKASFIANHFSNGNQFTIIGGANNVNEMGFTDGGAGRFRRFGGNNGITTSQALGLNFNVGRGDTIRVGGDVMYTHTKSDTRTTQNTQYLFADSLSFSDSKDNKIDRGHNVRADFRVLWNPDTLNVFELRPNLSLNFNDSESDSRQNIFAGVPATQQQGAHVNNSTTMMASKGSSYEFGARLIYTHKFSQKPGRSFSVYAQLRTSNVRERANTYSEIMYYILANDSIYDQYENNHTWSNTFQARASWTEPIGNPKKGHFLEAAYQLQYRWNNADKLTYDRLASLPTDQLMTLAPLASDIFNPELSNRFRNNYMNQDIRLGYKHVTATQNINVGISLVPQMSRSVNMIDDAKSIPARHTLNIAPYMRYRWKITKTRSFNIDYRGRSSQPSMAQLQPVADMSNPLNIVQGNPDLDPSFSHNLSLRFQDFNQDAQRSIMAMLRASVEQNSIVSRTTYDNITGGRFTTYANVNGNWSLNGFSMVSLPLRNKLFTFVNHFGGGYSHQVGFNNDERNLSANLSLFESPGIAYRPESLQLELRPTYRLQYTANSLANQADRTVHSFGGRFSAMYTTPFDLIINTDINYTANRGYGQGYNTDEWMWNASISYQTLRDKNLTLTLSVYDLLQQRSNIQRSVTANYIRDSRYNSLTRYFMFTVSYKFNTFKRHGSDIPADFGPGPGGPGPGHPGGQRPTGPPPGGGRPPMF